MAEDLTHTSECPVRHHFLPWHVQFNMSRYFTNAREKTFAAASFAIDPPHFVPASNRQDIKKTTYRLVFVVIGHVVGN